VNKPLIQEVKKAQSRLLKTSVELNMFRSKSTLLLKTKDAAIADGISMDILLVFDVRESFIHQLLYTDMYSCVLICTH